MVKIKFEWIIMNEYHYIRIILYGDQIALCHFFFKFLDEIVRMIDSAYIISNRDHFSRKPLYT